MSISPQALRQHAHLLGATGSGKSTLFQHLIARDIRFGHSFVVLDLRGDLVATTLELCAGHVAPDRVKLLDLREKGRPLGFNPLYGAGEPYFRALAVLDVVEAESESWGVQLAETLRNGLLLLAEAGRPLTALEGLFFDRPLLHECLQNCHSDSVLSFWRRFDELSNDRRAALAGPVLNKVSLLLATDALRAVLGHPAPLDLGAHLNRPGSILLVSLAADELHAAGRMVGRMVLASVCREIFARVEIPENHRNPVRLFVDEFEHFGQAEFESILAEGRRFGLSLVLAHQTLAQLSSRMRSLILGNVGTKVVFRTGREDSATMSRDLCGDAKAFDFSRLPVGDAILWQRGSGVKAVEINEPLIRDVARQSPLGRQFSRLVTASNTVVPKPAAPPSPISEHIVRKPNGSATPLEDWLCN